MTIRKSAEPDLLDLLDTPDRTGLTALAAEMVLWSPGFCHWRKRLQAARRLGLLSPAEACERTVIQTLMATLRDPRPGSDTYWVFLRSFFVAAPFTVAWSHGLIPALRQNLAENDNLASLWLQAAMSFFDVLTLSGDMGVSLLFGGTLALAIAAAVTPALVAALRGLFNDRRSEVRRACAVALGKLGDARAVPTLAEAALCANDSVRNAARASLMALLPEVGAEHALLLQDKGTRLLLRLLRGANEDEAIVLLRAIEAAGDPQFLANLRRLAQNEVRLEARLSYERATQALKDRLRRAHDPKLLLRPVSSAETPRERLVIPAANALHEETALLVRPM